MTVTPGMVVVLMAARPGNKTGTGEVLFSVHGSMASANAKRGSTSPFDPRNATLSGRLGSTFFHLMRKFVIRRRPPREYKLRDMGRHIATTGGATRKSAGKHRLGYRTRRSCCRVGGGATPHRAPRVV